MCGICADGVDRSGDYTEGQDGVDAPLTQHANIIVHFARRQVRGLKYHHPATLASTRDTSHHDFSTIPLGD